jgi:hypothetical protein
VPACALLAAGHAGGRYPVEQLVRQWRAARPELDFDPMGLFARSNRFVALGMRELEAALADHGVSVGEFDVLSALRRAGAPLSLKPSDLADRLLRRLTSGSTK